VTVYNDLSNDLRHYQDIYTSTWGISLIDYIRMYRFEPGFTTLLKFVSGWISFSDYLIVNQFIYFGSLLYLCRMVTPRSWLWAALALIVGVFLPTGYLISGSALRQSLALSALFVALGYLIGQLQVIPLQLAWRRPVFLALLALGVLFHYSMALIAVLVLIGIFLPHRFLFYGWLVLLALYTLGFPGLTGFLQNYLYPIIAANSTTDETAQWVPYTLGFKASWLAISIVPLPCFLLLWTRTYMTHSTMTLFKIYFAINSFCLLLINLPFSDRFFHYSWALVPAILATTLATGVRPILINLGLGHQATIDDYVYYSRIEHEEELKIDQESTPERSFKGVEI